MSQLKRTALYPLYSEYGAKTVNFGGWDMPVQFSSIKEEHFAVREHAGLFDVSHMGEAEVKGKGALSLLQKIATNDVSKLSPGKAQYTLMCYENGGTVDDLLIYMLAEDHYFLVLNAANTDKDIKWLHKFADDTVTVTDVSNEYSLLAIQGPKAEKIVQSITEINVSDISFFRFLHQADLGGVKALLSRTGYTGEDGFEIYCSSEDAQALWKTLMKAGEQDGLLPCGLGARDTLRFEARLPLYGQEIDETISPLEAGLGFAVKVNKEEDFIGKTSLQEEKENGPTRKLAGLEMVEKGIPRTGYEIFNENHEQIGHITSGTQSPTLKKNVGLGLINAEWAEVGTTLYVQIRKKRLKAKVIKTPFYRRSKS